MQEDSPELQVWKQHNTRSTCVLEVGGFRPTGQACASHIGLEPLLAPGEAWPLDGAGQPMQFIAQLNLQQAPWLPEALQGLALLQFFCGEQFIESGCAPETWALRLRPSLDGLQPRPQPPFRDRPWVGRGFEARWLAPQDDHPSYDDENMRLPPGMQEFPEEAHGLCLGRTKLGGYAKSLQHGISFFAFTEDADGVWQPSPDEPDYVLQIDSEEKAGLNWVDGGIVYLGRHPLTGRWSAHCQFY
ncbi:DUF1963 domain-containing protein [Comamonas composti]|uniref:DUF1963 domain-containing protein n=1 Tax=Comamonas composti TaxID=408558 RepID=UPI0004051A28|nr:DUF1963 domain-containing protein [Comamonas composti]